MKVDKKKKRELCYVVYRGNRKRKHTETQRCPTDVFPKSSVENTLVQRDLPSMPAAQNLEEEGKAII